MKKKELKKAEQSFKDTLQCAWRCRDGSGKKVTKHLIGCVWYKPTPSSCKCQCHDYKTVGEFKHIETCNHRTYTVCQPTEKPMDWEDKVVWIVENSGSPDISVDLIMLIKDLLKEEREKK